MSLKLLFLRKLTEADMAQFEERLRFYYEFIIPRSYTEEDLQKLAGDADVLVGNIVSGPLIRSAQKTKLIQILGAGVDQVAIDIVVSKKIILCNSHSNGQYVAEHALSMMHALFKKICLHHQLMRKGLSWRPQGTPEDILFMSDTIIGKKIGVLGLGEIGKSIVQYLSGFPVNFSIVTKTPNKHEQFAEKYFNLDFVEKRECISSSDIIFVTLPLTQETQDYLSFQEFKSMKKDVLVVNVSRGIIVNEKALYNSLSEQKIGGAALDVWYDSYKITAGKKFPSNRYPFHKLDNVILSPYRAGYVLNQSSHLLDALQNLELFAKENRVINQVNPSLGY